MSAASRVFNPVLCRQLPTASQLNRVKRNLYPSVGSSETSRLFEEESDKLQEKACKKWGFDFRAGLPLQNNSQFIWERVPFPEYNHTPEMYTLTHAAHVRPTIPQPTPFDLLMDKRAERENFDANDFVLSTTDTDSCDDSQDESMPVVSKFPTSIVGAQMTAIDVGFNRVALKKRQPKITEYMKERKRLAQAPKKLGTSPPAKRMRTSSNSSNGNGSSTHFLHQQPRIAMHFTMQRNLQRQQRHNE